MTPEEEAREALAKLTPEQRKRISEVGRELLRKMETGEYEWPERQTVWARMEGRKLIVEIECQHLLPELCFCGAVDEYPPGTLLMPRKVRTEFG